MELCTALALRRENTASQLSKLLDKLASIIAIGYRITHVSEKTAMSPACTTLTS